MRSITTGLALALLLAGSAVAGAQAQAAANPSLTVSVENRTAAAAARRGAPRADSTVHAGDTLHYRLTLTNPGPGDVHNVAVSNPLPRGLRLVAGSPRASRGDARLEFSADDGRTFAERPEETVMVDGRAVRRPIPAERFTHVRVTVVGALAAKAAVMVEYDATLAASPTRTSSGGSR